MKYLDKGGGARSFKDLSLLEGLCRASSLLFSLSDSPEGWYMGICKRSLINQLKENEFSKQSYNYGCHKQSFQ